MAKKTFINAVALLLVLGCMAPKQKTTNLPKTTNNVAKADSLYQIAGQLMLKNEQPKALVLLNKAIQLNPQNANYYLDRGAAKVNLLLYQEGLSDLKEALNRNLINEKVYVNMAVAENNIAIEINNLSHLDTAIVYSTKAIQLNNNFGFAYYIRGESFLFKGDTISLCNNLSKALKTGFNEAMPRILKYCSKKQITMKQNIFLLFAMVLFCTAIAYVQLGKAGISQNIGSFYYRDIEFNPNIPHACFLKDGKLYVGELDTIRGGFLNRTNGCDYLVDSSAVIIKNGAEWGQVNGEECVFYTRYCKGNTCLAMSCFNPKSDTVSYSLPKILQKEKTNTYAIIPKLINNDRPY